MTVSRILNKLNFEREEKFIFVYGNVNDEFCDNELIIGNLEYALWKYFKNHDYQRVVFFNTSQKVYFLDSDSIKSDINYEKTYSEITSGPLGEINFFSEKKEISNYKYTDINELTYLSSLEMLGSLVSEKISTIIIFSNAEEISSENIGKKEFELWENFLKNCSNTSRYSKNKFVFIFQVPETEKLFSIMEKNKMNVLNNYLWFKEKQYSNNLLKIGFPENDEINNLIHHFRLLGSLKVNWEFVSYLPKFLADQKISLKNWYIKFQKIPPDSFLDKNILYEWLDEGFINQTSKFLIERMDKKFSISELLFHLNKLECQDDIKEEIINSLEFWYFLKNKTKPLSFFMLGSSGTGKTLTAKLIGESLKPLGYDFFMINMTEYQEKESISNLLGSPSGYIGSENEPKIFKALAKANNKLVILFDEIEKAHPNIFKTLIQLLEEGIISWNNGEGNFKNCIICLTSNTQSFKLTEMKNSYLDSDIKDEIIFQNKVRDVLVDSGISPEICRRINLFLVYNMLTMEAIIKIAFNEIENLASDYGIEIVFVSPIFLAELAKKVSGSIYGTGAFKNYIFSKIGKLLIKFKDTDFAKAIIQINNNQLEITYFGNELVYNKDDIISKSIEILKTDGIIK